MSLHARERVHVRVEREAPKRAAILAANTGSECAGAGALSRPRANACVCVYPCRSSGRPWEPIQRLPEPGAAADGQRSPRMKDNLYPRWPVEKAALGRLGRDWSQVDAEEQEEQRKTKKKRSRCVLIGRTTGGQCLR